MEKCVKKKDTDSPKFKQKSTIIFWQFKGHNSRTEKVLKSEIECDLPYMVPDIVYEYQMICWR
jgi:hypothetical protein